MCISNLLSLVYMKIISIVCYMINAQQSEPPQCHYFNLSFSMRTSTHILFATLLYFSEEFLLMFIHILKVVLVNLSMKAKTYEIIERVYMYIILT